MADTTAPESAPAETQATEQQPRGERRGRRGFGRGGDRKEGGGDRRGGNRRGGAGEGKWIPVTKLGRLVQAGKINRIEDIYYHAIPIKEAQIVDHFLGNVLKDEIMGIMPVQRQTTAGQRTRFKAFVAVGDNNGHIGLGVKCAAEVAGAIAGALTVAKTSVIPVRRGYWGSTAGDAHTVPMKVTGRCGSVRVRLIPAPRGTGLVASPLTKRFLTMAGIHDCYSSSTGKTRTTGNTIKACYMALRETYGYLTPDLWKDVPVKMSPFTEHAEYLEKGKLQRDSETGGRRGGRPQRGRRN